MIPMPGTIEHAAQTLKRWEEYIEWRKAELRGEDLTLLAQQWKQEELDGLAAQRLAISEIAAAFPDEAPALCRRHISRLSRTINPFLDEVRMIKSMDLEPAAEKMVLFCARMRFKADDAIVQRKTLRSILSATTVAVAKEEGKFESISERDVENARSIGIESIYAFEGGRKVGQRFRACCPFHNEKTGSFFVFKDGKFRCFGCGEHGDTIDFFMKVNNVEFIDAVKLLIRR